MSEFNLIDRKNIEYVLKLKTSQIDGLTREKKTPSMQKLERLPKKIIVNISNQRSDEREKNLRTIHATF